MPQALHPAARAVVVFAAFWFVGQAFIQPGLQRLGGPQATPELLDAADLTGPAQQALRAELGRLAATARPPAASLAVPVGRPGAEGRPARVPAPRMALLIDGVAGPVNTSQPVALPGGSRFRLQLQGGTEASWVTVYALTPDGRAPDAPLWQAELPAHGLLASPALRLTGQTGMETLRVQRRSLRDGSVNEEQVRLLHH